MATTGSFLFDPNLAVICDEAVERAGMNLQEITGGFGVVLGFAHDWASREAMLRSWDLFARYVVPEINGYTRNLQGSADYVADNQKELMKGATAAVVAKIQDDPRAAAAMAVTMEQARKQAQAGEVRPNVPAPEEEEAAKSADA